MDFNNKFGNCPIYYTISKLKENGSGLSYINFVNSAVLRYNRLWEELQPSPIEH